MLSRSVLLFVALTAVLWAGCRNEVSLYGLPNGEAAASSPSASQSASAVATTTGGGQGGTGQSTGQGGSATVCGDGDCEGDETPESCPRDCSPSNSCSHSVCEVGEALDPSCDSCVATVCAQDAYCCDNQWDDTCVTAADASCNTGCCGNGKCEGQSCASCPEDCGECVCGDGKCEGENCEDCAADCGPCPSCPHSVCESGVPLSLTECRPFCVDEVCKQDPTCCGQGWKSECTALAASLCSPPDPCLDGVCQKNASCCSASGKWTQDCVKLAASVCKSKCNCAHSVCSQGPALNPSCDPCAKAVCLADPYCCNNDWDGLCVGQVAGVCGIDCP